MNTKLLKRFGSALTVISFFASIFVLAVFFKSHGTAGVFAGFSMISPLKIMLSAVFTALSYLFLVFYDSLAIRYAGQKLGFKRTAAVSFTANAFGNNLGLSILSSSAVRLRLYSLWDFTTQEIGSIIIFCNAAEITGFAALSLLLLNTSLWPAAFHPFIKYSCFSAAVVLGAALILYFIWSSFSKKNFAAFGAVYKPAGFMMAAAQTAVSAIDWSFAGLALFILLPDGSINIYLFFAAYLASEILGIASNIPGGFGVFDAAAISLLSTDSGAASGVISAIILFRLIYYMLPLAMSYVVYGLSEAESARSNIFIKAGEIKDMLSSTPGYVFSFFSFLAGSAAIYISSVPLFQPRTALMQAVFPPLLLGIFAVACALSGAWLIMLTRGLQKNIYSSYNSSLAVYVLISLLLLTQGFSYEAAFLISVIFFIMLFFRDSFYRKAGPFSEKPTAGLFMTTTGVISVCAMLVYLTGSPASGIFSMRGSLPLFSAAVVLLVWIINDIFRPFKPMPHSASGYDIHTAAKIAFDDPDTLAQLALMGDKKLIFSLSRSSFIMYAQCGSHFVALGDPVGPYVEMEELIWKFKKFARQNKGTPVFFNTTDDNLHFYDNSDLNFYRIGEEAKVALEYYPQEKKKDDRLRSLSARLESQGYSFRMMPRNSPPAFYKSAEAVSTDWLKARKLKETGFLIGAFDQEFLKHFHTAAVYKNDTLVLFADILSSMNRDEFRIDMMRSAKGVPDEIEKYLAYKLVAWGKEKHYAFFNLGLAPLPNSEISAFTPALNKAAPALYNHGARFESTRVLKDEKEEFSPSWQPRYIICDNFMQVPSVFSEISLLVEDYKK
jgi:phosphatidylglycerol lysyltransferase